MEASEHDVAEASVLGGERGASIAAAGPGCVEVTLSLLLLQSEGGCWILTGAGRMFEESL